MNTRRRLMLVLGAGALGVVSGVVSGQTQGKVWRIGVVANRQSGLTAGPSYAIFLRELRALGYVEGGNLQMVIRSADNHPERFPALAAELVAERVDLLVAFFTRAAQAMQQASSSIPIVFVEVADPVSSGFVQSLARPGGNMTGTSNLGVELSAKRLEILKECLPKVSRVAIFVTEDQQVPDQVEQAQNAARNLGITLLVTQLGRREGLADVSKKLRAWRADGIYVAQAGISGSNGKLLLELAAQLRLPAIYPDGWYVEEGGLISYGLHRKDIYRKAAHYVDKILKGAKPADLPVEQPTKFELALNMKTAKTLGIKIPQSVLLRADNLIE